MNATLIVQLKCFHLSFWTLAFSPTVRSSVFLFSSLICCCSDICVVCTPFDVPKYLQFARCWSFEQAIFKHWIAFNVPLFFPLHWFSSMGTHVSSFLSPSFSISFFCPLFCLFNHRQQYSRSVIQFSKEYTKRRWADERWMTYLFLFYVVRRKD